MQISSVTHIRNYRLAIEFDDDSTKTIDLEKYIRNSDSPVIEEYLDIDLFCEVYLNELGSLCWGDNEMVITNESILSGEFDVI